MPDKKGRIVLMGSGELTATMVEVHKALLRPYGNAPSAVFLDTPAGFQLNVDHLSRKAADYFSRRVQKPLQLASFKGAQAVDDAEAQRAFATLRSADYILIGPGSPTYALQQWQQSPIPDMMIDCINAGGCLVAASAAALTVGRYTLPVYEIYKVGQPVHWADGLDLLGRFGFNWVVIPHWNNAEGGNHDTRYCFMGAPRLGQLENLLPEQTPILGLDEHTALIIDLSKSHADIEGIGRVTLRSRGREQVFAKGDRLPLSLLRGEFDTGDEGFDKKETHQAIQADEAVGAGESDVWSNLHRVADGVRKALDQGEDQRAAGGVLELERLIWQSQSYLEEINEMGAARELMREMISLVGAQLGNRPESRQACLAPLVDALIALREQFRKNQAWDAADAVRDRLMQVGVSLMDTPEGTKWELG